MHGWCPRSKRRFRRVVLAMAVRVGGGEGVVVDPLAHLRYDVAYSMNRYVTTTARPPTDSVIMWIWIA